MKVGDLVTIKSQDPAITYCIIDFRANKDGECVAVLKALYNNILVIEVELEKLDNVLPKGKL